jgi:tRNA threonylcarbamoyladenosine biosynthesis protein TsaB
MGDPGPTAAEPFGGLFLAMDTSTREGSAALGRRSGDGVVEILGRVSLAAEEEHASLLIPRIGELMEEVGADMEELEGIVAGAGPGSFTGVRVGAATGKGLAQALGLPLWAFSSLAAAAVSPDGEEEASLHPRCVLFDARGDRVYVAAYRIAHDRLETLLEPTATTVTDLMEELIPPGALLMGDGATRHQDLLGGAGHPVLLPPAGVPTADGLLRLLHLDADARPLTDPGRWEPDYLRTSGAERTWKTRKGW